MPRFGNVTIEVMPENHIIQLQQGAIVADVELRGDVTGGDGTYKIETELKKIFEQGTIIQNIRSITVDEKGRITGWELNRFVSDIQISYFPVMMDGENRWHISGISRIHDVKINGISYVQACHVSGEYVEYAPMRDFNFDPPYRTEFGDLVSVWWYGVH